MSEVDPLLLNLNQDRNLKCMSVVYRVVVLCLLVVSAFFTSFTYYSLHDDSADIKNLLTQLTTMLLNQSYP
jgi:hypothetical protein